MDSTGPLLVTTGGSGTFADWVVQGNTLVHLDVTGNGHDLYMPYSYAPYNASLFVPGLVGNGFAAFDSSAISSTNSFFNGNGSFTFRVWFNCPPRTSATV